MPASPDPVSEPDKYRSLLFSLLGDDDPAHVQAATAATLRAIIADAGDLLSTRPEPSEWSPLECVAHVVQAEIVYAARYRWILAHESPPLIGYDQDLWVERLRGNEADPEALVRIVRCVAAREPRIVAANARERALPRGDARGARP